VMERSACVCWVVVKLHTEYFLCVRKQCQCAKPLCIYVHILSVCVSVAACSWCGCFPLCVFGTRIGLSFTVKWGGVGDDRCRRGEERE